MLNPLFVSLFTLQSTISNIINLWLEWMQYILYTQTLKFTVYPPKPDTEYWILQSQTFWKHAVREKKKIGLWTFCLELHNDVIFLQTQNTSQTWTK